MGADFDPPCPLELAALEEDWDSDVRAGGGAADSAGGGTSDARSMDIFVWNGGEVEVVQEGEQGEGASDVKVSRDNKGRPIRVLTPSAGVAVISGLDEDTSSTPSPA